jgi:hypothetical protein
MPQARKQAWNRAARLMANADPQASRRARPPLPPRSAGCPCSAQTLAQLLTPHRVRQPVPNYARATTSSAQNVKPPIPASQRSRPESGRLAAGAAADSGASPRTPHDRKSSVGSMEDFKKQMTELSAQLETQMATAFTMLDKLPSPRGSRDGSQHGGSQHDSGGSADRTGVPRYMQQTLAVSCPFVVKGCSGADRLRSTRGSERSQRPSRRSPRRRRAP